MTSSEKDSDEGTATAGRAWRRGVSSERPGAFADCFRFTAEKTLSAWTRWLYLRRGKRRRICARTPLSFERPLDPAGREAAWLTWARGLADGLDPLKNGYLDGAV